MDTFTEHEPIPFTREEIEEFKALMRKESSVELTDQEAWDRVTVLVSLYRMFLGPIPEDPETEDRSGEKGVESRRVIACLGEQPAHRSDLPYGQLPLNL